MGTVASLPAQPARSWFDDRWLLPVEGFVSGALACAAPWLARPFVPAIDAALPIVYVSSGLIFGGIIACHFRLFRGIRSTNTLAGFAGICGAAYIVSILATIVGIPLRPPAFNSFVGLGAVLGIIIASCFWLLRGARFADGLAGFMAICAVALVVWGIATVKTHFGSGLESGGLLDPPDSAFFWGGLVGALIVCGGVFFLLLPATTNVRIFLAKALVISVACGYLGILSWALGDRWWPSTNDRLYTLYIVWQTSTAGLLAFLLPRQRTSLPVIGRTRSPKAPRIRGAREEYERRVARP